MKLEIGKSYRNGWGKLRTVAGVTRDYPEWVWTLQGEWFRQSDGRFITYSRDQTEHVLMTMATNYDLISEAFSYDDE